MGGFEPIWVQAAFTDNAFLELSQHFILNAGPVGFEPKSGRNP
jgi:hypothetical protein